MSELPAEPNQQIKFRPHLFGLVAAAVWISLLASAAFSLVVFYRLGVTDIYGDALAHMEGARRIFDSMTPGYPEIGTVWLPLFHLIVSPLATNDFLWRTGLAGSFVSMACFVAAAWFLFRLGLEMSASLGAGLVALAGFVFCPNMLYLASTPMTEPMAILWAVLTVYALFRYQQSGSYRTLALAALAAFAGTLTRYDEWYVLPFAAAFVFMARPGSWDQRFRRFLLFSLIAGAGPVLWLLHNAYRFGNPLEFYDGPSSAKAIYARQLATTGFRYPTAGSLVTSARYYLQDLRLVVGPWSLVLSVLGLVALLADWQNRRSRSAGLLLLAPLPFYVQAMAHAAIPLYVPTFFPFTYYNLRYGLELLPAMALLPCFVLSARLDAPTRRILTAGLVAVIAWQGWVQIGRGPLRLPLVRESVLNTPCKAPLEQAVTQFLRARYDGGRILMASGKWPCVASGVGIDYRNILTQNNRRYWVQIPTDPGRWVEWIVSGNGDAVDNLMRAYPRSFQDFVPVLRVTAQRKTVTIYRRRAS
jgi:hypothetical protein